VLSSESLARRGITNVSDAIRAVSADSSGTIPNAFATGFGGGASAPSLRGLTVNSTLTLVDGQRVVNYPASDDGQRAFVDLNTMPRVSIERIEVLKDGASSTYGADAIGGVINIIQRKQFNGVDATLEAGTSQHGGGDQYRGSILAGWGDYDDRGFNVYVGAEFEKNRKIFARDRGFPFNTNDLTRLNGGLNLNADLTNSGITPTVAAVRPAIQLFNNDLLQATPGSGFVLLDPAQCADIGGTLTFDPTIGESCEEKPGRELRGDPAEDHALRFGRARFPPPQRQCRSLSEPQLVPEHPHCRRLLGRSAGHQSDPDDDVRPSELRLLGRHQLRHGGGPGFEPLQSLCCGRRHTAR